MHPRLFWTIIAALVLACGGGIALSAQGTPETAGNSSPASATAESIAAGKLVFQRRCVACHGVKGEGGPGNDLIPAAPSLIDEKWDHGSTDRAVFNNIKNGIPPDFNMGPWGDQIKDEDIWNVVSYMRSIVTKK